MPDITIILNEEEKSAFLQMCDLLLKQHGINAHKTVTHFLNKIVKSEAKVEAAKIEEPE